MGKKEYLGDGVYIHYDGFHVVLTTENGVEVSNTIYLDDQVVLRLMRWLKGFDGGIGK